MIETTDSLFAHKFFQRAGQNVLEIMLNRLNTSSTKEGSGSTNDTQTAMTAAERKKEKNKLKKLAKKEEAAAATTAPTSEEKKQTNKKGQQTPVDDDPVGAKILEKDILEECTRWCHLLTKGGRCKDPKTLALVCEVMLKKQKYVLALRCLTTGLAVDSTHPMLNFQLVSFAKQFYSRIGLSTPVSSTEEQKPITPVVEEVVRDRLCELLGGEGDENLHNFLEAYIQRISTNSFTLLHHVIAAKAILVFQHGENDTQRLQRVMSLVFANNFDQQRGINYKNIMTVLKVIIDYIIITFYFRSLNLISITPNWCHYSVEKFRNYIPVLISLIHLALLSIKVLWISNQ